MKNLFFLIVFALIFISCGSRDEEKMINERITILKEIAREINEDFSLIRNEVKLLADKIRYYYEKKDSILPTINKSKYKLTKTGVFYKPVNDGGSAVFVSGYIPVDEKIKQIVYFTEAMDKDLADIVNRYPEVIQAYYNDKYSYNRIYPFFDVLAQYEPKLNIPSYNFYYLADEKHNPERKAVFVDEPYVDPAGRGWMISAIAPVYINDELVGVPGLDVTINTITERYVKNQVDSKIMILDKNGVIVTAQEYLFNLFSFPPLKDHKYIETIKANTFRKEDYNLLTGSLDKRVRELAYKIIKEKQKIVDFIKGDEKFKIIAEEIPELNWTIIDVIPI